MRLCLHFEQSEVGGSDLLIIPSTSPEHTHAHFSGVTVRPKHVSRVRSRKNASVWIFCVTIPRRRSCGVSGAARVVAVLPVRLVVPPITTSRVAVTATVRRRLAGLLVSVVSVAVVVEADSWCLSVFLYKNLEPIQLVLFPLPVK